LYLSDIGVEVTIFIYLLTFTLRISYIFVPSRVGRRAPAKETRASQVFEKVVQRLPLLAAGAIF
jgi:hypothetical protein